MITPRESKKPSIYILLSPPRIHHLKPSITPTMGFKEYKSRHFSGITLLLKPTGEIYKPSWTMKGTMYRAFCYCYCLVCCVMVSFMVVFNECSYF